MAPAADISWQSVFIDAKVHGPFTKPDANGTVKINALAAAGTRIGSLTADVTGNAGQVKLNATVSDLHLPGPRPDIFAADPVTLTASAQLDAADRPVTFDLHHPLVSIQGTARTAGVQQVQAHLVLPDLSPLAAAAGVDLQGHTDFAIQAELADQTTTAAVKGRVSITGGMAPVPALIGDDGSIDFAASMHGQDITVSRMEVNGKALDVSATGGLSDQTLHADWSVALADLSAVQPSLSGRVDAKGHATGKLNDLAVQADVGADLSAKGFSPGHITAKVDATGLPTAPHATVTADGALLDSPLALALTADESAGAFKVDVSQASWKSLQAGGTASLTPPAVIPVGSLHIDIGRLADFEPLLGRPLTGQANATLDSDDSAAKLNVSVRDAALTGTAAISKAMLNATITDPTGHPAIDGSFTADGVSAGTTKSVSARMTAKGPIDAVGITVAADAPEVGGGPAKLAAAGTLDAEVELWRFLGWRRAGSSRS